MACFADINVSQGSVATYTQGVVGFKFPFDCEVTKESSSEEKNNKSAKIGQNYLWPRFFGPCCI